MRLSVLLLLLTCLMLTGCPRNEETVPGSLSSRETELVPVSVAEESEPGTVSSPGEVNYRCQTDADCAVKNVGNCCGYYPACVNTDSPTFPGQVKAKCEAEGTMSVCGFPELKGCQCVDNRCEGIRGEANALPVQ